MSFTMANDAGRAVLADGDDLYDIATVTDGRIGPDPMAAIAASDELHSISLANHEPTGSLAGARLGPPSPRPVNCFGIGLNYRSHIEETGVAGSDVPVVFTKFPSCISPPHAEVQLVGDSVDYEAELVVVIGKGGRDLPAEAAWDCVAGLTAGQDISDRALQFAANPPHFDLGKSRDGYGPIGPVLVSPDSFADYDDIALECRVNGEVRQSATTAQLIHDVPALIAYISAILTLSPGDLIFTGTPEGVGVASGNLLRPGDVIETTLAGIGTMTNRCT
ncbi:MAG: fumarylacetoacetate hydrolase family protein [Actinomycetia bacterium]|nr:fumarylacetoacetate hydrolase family protein [Actinomycetes bacterium]